MDDEEFEKVFENITEIFLKRLVLDYDEVDIEYITDDEEERKRKVKEILEEIYQKGYDACDECKSLQR